MTRLAIVDDHEALREGLEALLAGNDLEVVGTAGNAAAALDVVHHARPEIVLADIYAAGEESIPGVTVDRLAESIRKGSGRPVHVARTLDDVMATLQRIVKPGDAVVTLGAGSIGTLPRRLMKALDARGATS